MITHVAIRFANRVWSLPKPNRHHNIIAKIVDELNVDHVPVIGEDQGFLDDTGKYLTRSEAFRHAIECGQIAADIVTGRPNRLYSEDVW